MNHESKKRLAEIIHLLESPEPLDRDQLLLLASEIWLYGVSGYTKSVSHSAYSNNSGTLFKPNYKSEGY